MLRNIFMLQGQVQNYAWGGYTFLAELLHLDNTAHQPMAEYWMGAHPKASSLLHTDGGDIVLSDAITQSPEHFVGTAVWKRFGELPYLFKILDVHEMLSIQVHPSKREAEKGFDRENAAGIPLSAPHRNYKDRNHKPEMMIALSEFWLLHGFMTPDKIQQRLAGIPELAVLQPYFAGQHIKALYQYIMELPQSEVDAILRPLVVRELAAKQQGILDKSLPGWWVAKLYPDQIPTQNLDRGIFSIYLFNIVKIDTGNGIFQGAGIPHAYLEGQNVELMANSDNVLRGGLTPKHVDVPELLQHTLFEGITPAILEVDKSARGQIFYPCPVDDFGIAAIQLQGGQPALDLAAASLEIIIVMQGQLQIKSGEDILVLERGQTAAILPAATYQLSAETDTVAYRAFVPPIK